jgi:hypothetical protein
LETARYSLQLRGNRLLMSAVRTVVTNFVREEGALALIVEFLLALLTAQIM